MRLAALLLAMLWLSEAPAASPTPSAQTKSGFVTVNGVKLHYIDWGGVGETVLFLPGFNDTAHVYDDFAPHFSDRFHVLGLTRRGVGESDKPSGGYDTRTRVEDIRCFLDAVHIRSAALIGHSMAGDELTLFATKYPDRVSKLVYLDAAYDRKPEWWIAGLSDPASTPGMMQRMRMEALDLPGAANIHVENMPPPSQWAILVATHKAIFAFRPDYTKIQAPALAFYAATSSKHYPHHALPSNADANLRAKADEYWQKVGRPIAQKNVEQFRKQIAHGEIVELNDAQHYVFLGETAQEVASKIREFLLR